MKKALRIGAFRGINVFLHWSFLLLIGGVFIYDLAQGEALTVALRGTFLILAVFVCVLLHEFGHALTAMRYHIPTLDITLYPIGGVARMKLIPKEPLHEFWIAIAGPAVNAILAILFSGILFLLEGPFSLERILTLKPEAATFPDLLAALLVINLILAVFNLLPAFPMDGGRILRALLAHFMADYARATQIAAQVGQAMAFFLGLMGILIFNPILMLIAAFVYFGARQEAIQSVLRSTLREVRARDVMIRRFRPLNDASTLSEAINELLAGADRIFPVINDDGVQGIVTRERLLKAFQTYEPTSTPISKIVRSDLPTFDESTLVIDLLPLLNDPLQPAIAITRNREFVGLLTMESLRNWYALQSALKRSINRQQSKITSVAASHPPLLHTS